LPPSASIRAAVAPSSSMVSRDVSGPRTSASYRERFDPTASAKLAETVLRACAAKPGLTDAANARKVSGMRDVQVLILSIGPGNSENGCRSHVLASPSRYGHPECRRQLAASPRAQRDVPGGEGPGGWLTVGDSPTRRWCAPSLTGLGGERTRLKACRISTEARVAARGARTCSPPTMRTLTTAGDSAGC
jgi:hypothetical protein